MASISLTVRPNKDKTVFSINGTISHMGERRVASLGVKIPKSIYSGSSSNDYIQGKSQEASDARARIFKAKSILTELERDFTNRNGVEPPIDYLVAELKKMLHGEHKGLSKDQRKEKLRQKAEQDEFEARDLIYYLEDYIKTKTGLYSNQTINNYKTNLKMLKLFCDRYNYTCQLKDLNNAFMSKFLNFLCNDEVTETNDKGSKIVVKKLYENASAEKAVTNLLVVMNYYEEVFGDLKIKKKKILGDLRVHDSRHTKKDDLAFISFEELLEFYSWDCEVYGQYKEEFEATRDCYVVSAVTGLRHNELYFIDRESVQVVMKPEPHKVLNITTDKTGHNTTTICPKLVEEIIEKWSQKSFDAPKRTLVINGRKERKEFPECLLPVRSSVKMNKRLHKLFHDIGWFQMKQAYGDAITPENKEEFEPVGFWKTIRRVRYSGAKRMEDVLARHELLTFHSSRHTFACYLLREGLPLKTISELLGHDSVKTTEDYYAQLLSQDVTYSASKLIESNRSLANAMKRVELMRVSA
jgi:integrase